MVYQCTGITTVWSFCTDYKRGKPNKSEICFRFSDFGFRFWRFISFPPSNRKGHLSLFITVYSTCHKTDISTKHLHWNIQLGLRWTGNVFNPVHQVKSTAQYPPEPRSYLPTCLMPYGSFRKYRWGDYYYSTIELKLAPYCKAHFL